MGFIPGEGPADRYNPKLPSISQQNLNRDAVSQTLLSQDFIAEANAAKQRRDETIDGQRAIRDAVESRRDDLLNRLKADEAKRQNNPNDPTLMTPNDRFSVALQQKSAEDMAAAVGRHVQAMEEADQAAKDAAKAAEVALKSIEGYERTIREQGLTPVGRVYARRDDLGFAPGSAFGNRAAVAADSEAKRILDEEQQRIDKQNATLYAPRSFQSAAPGEKGISLGLDLSGDIDKVNKQIDEAMKTWAGNIEARLKNTAIPLQQVTLAGRERDEQSALGQNAENRLRLQAQYDQQRVHSFQEEVEYQKQISALEAADLQIKLQAAQQKEADAGQDVVKQARAALEVDRARLAIQEQQLKVLVQQAQLQAQNPFASGSLKSGWDQFIHDASVQAEQPGKILYDSLNRGIDGISANMAKMLTGQKSAWAQTFKEIGDEMVKASIKAELLTLLGKIPGTQAGQAGTGGSGGATGIGQGGLFGGGSLGGGIFSFLKSVLKKPASGDSGQTDNTGSWVPPSSPSSQGRRLPDGLIERTGPTGYPGDPIHVIQDGQGSISNGAAGILGTGAFAAGGGLASLLSAGGSGATEAVSSSISFAGEFANGGYIPSGSYGIAGENGPEPVFGPAHVMSNKDAFGSKDTHNHYYTIDARGAELGAVNRIERGLEAVHGSIERRAARSVYENNRRTPRNRR
jgi:lambda family phage tail tape measure protein